MAGSVPSVLEGQYANLQLIQKHTHQKAIVVDTRYAIAGSFNFPRMTRVKNDETSSKIYEPDAIEKLRGRVLLGRFKGPDLMFQPKPARPSSMGVAGCVPCHLIQPSAPAVREALIRKLHPWSLFREA